ncbi:hypothetical protein HWD99_12185 [Microbacterium sp. C5A9]|uniref:hypothetical protein n=1 Tax=Microbacterium sp. C5A9 TaxID=2736663 RepID=UPI001F51C484|nr:hypothetical protein [Microbacterium sp. C5A9]MCI1019386.1 hypothetical protein [Microbacterium sp. C5A9]
MDAHGAAEVLLRLIQDEINQAGYARYRMIRDRLAHEVGDDLALIQKVGRRNISPAVQAEFRKLPGWQALDWHPQRQRWTTAS